MKRRVIDPTKARVLFDSQLNQPSELQGQQFFAVLETTDHGCQEIRRHYFIEVQLMSGGPRNKPHECKSASAVAVTKGMDGVERPQE